MINSVNKYALSVLFNPADAQIYEIPKYQREYTWSTAEWEALFDDITENGMNYFLGSIICINTSQDPLNQKLLEVVDGQQRLTTLSLLLAALYKVFQDRKNELDEDQLSDVRQLKLKLVLRGQETQTHVIPQVQNNNLRDYLWILAQSGVLKSQSYVQNAGKRRISRAYNYFIKRLETYYASQETGISALFDLLDIINSTILVMIEVSSHADAYILFESLNNRGTPLTAVDLLKNSLLAQLDRKHPQELDVYFDQWTQILDLLGDDYSTQERFFRHHYNALRSELNQPFLDPSVPDRRYPLGPAAIRSNLLKIYDRLIKHDPVRIIDLLLEHASLYSPLLLINTENVPSVLVKAYMNLDRSEGRPAYLLLLFLLKYKEKLALTDQSLAEIVRLISRFFVRRNLTNVPPTRELNRLFMDIVEQLEQRSMTGPDVYLYIRNRLVDESVSDEEFEQTLRGPIYETNYTATRFILCTLAEQHMTQESYIDLWRYNNAKQYVWTVEHILPQGENIPDSWVQMIVPGGDVAKAKIIQNSHVHTIGNLTITGYNSTLGNKSFEDKKERKDTNGNAVGYNNGLALNMDVYNQPVWTMDQIESRTQRLIPEILRVFSL